MKLSILRETIVDYKGIIASIWTEPKITDLARRVKSGEAKFLPKNFEAIQLQPDTKEEEESEQPEIHCDVVEGANHERYPHIVPAGSIPWVDRDMPHHRQLHIAFHEMIEEPLIKAFVSAGSSRSEAYDKAHEFANASELRFRKGNFKA
jgi:hypothetical protein